MAEGIVVVTGGGRGIGRAYCAAFARAGYRVVVADVDEASARAVALQIGGIARRLDVRDVASWGALVEEVGAIDVLVNNAGIMALGAFTAIDRAVDVRQIDINVWGVMNGMRAVLPGMVARGRGTVINVASAAGKAGVPFAATYAATKHAVVGLTEAVRYELRDTGVKFLLVLPSLVDTELISGTGRPRFPPVATPDQVAAASLAAMRRGDADVYVPRFARLAAILPAVFPRAVYERVGRWLAADTMFAHVDPAGRAAYVRRAHG